MGVCTAWHALRSTHRLVFGPWKVTATAGQTKRTNRPIFLQGGDIKSKMAPRTSRKPTPHLPLGLVEALCEEANMEQGESAVFTEAFQRRRLRIVDQSDYATSPDDYVDAGPLYGESSSSGIQRNALHHAATHADPIAVCELIRSVKSMRHRCYDGAHTFLDTGCVPRSTSRTPSETHRWR